MKALIEIRDLHKFYGAFEALRGIQLDIVEQAPPDPFFSAPREPRTRAFLQAILQH